MGFQHVRNHRDESRAGLLPRRQAVVITAAAWPALRGRNERRCGRNSQPGGLRDDSSGNSTPLGQALGRPQIPECPAWPVLVAGTFPFLASFPRPAGLVLEGRMAGALWARPPAGGPGRSASKRGLTVWSKNPIRLHDSTEPQPDIALVKLRPDFYAAAHPGPAGRSEKPGDHPGAGAIRRGLTAIAGASASGGQAAVIP